MPAKKGTPPEMITVEEMAPRLGCGADNLRKAIDCGAFPLGWAFNPSGRSHTRYYVVRAEFEKYMAGEYPTMMLRFITAELLPRLTPTT